MRQGNRVHPRKHGNHRSGKEACSQQDAVDPVLSVHLLEKSHRSIASDKRGQAIKNHNSSKNRSTPGSRNETHQCQQQVTERQNNELVTDTDCSAKQSGVLGKAKDIAMNQLPTRLQANQETKRRLEWVPFGVKRLENPADVSTLTYLFFLQRLIVQFHVLGKVILQDTKQDNGQKGRQEENQDERVDNGQPVNLKRSGNETRIRVASQTILPGQVGFLIPLHRVRELDHLRSIHVGDIDLAIHLWCVVK